MIDHQTAEGCQLFVAREAAAGYGFVRGKVLARWRGGVAEVARGRRIHEVPEAGFGEFEDVRWGQRG